MASSSGELGQLRAGGTLSATFAPLASVSAARVSIAATFGRSFSPLSSSAEALLSLSAGVAGMLAPLILVARGGLPFKVPAYRVAGAVGEEGRLVIVGGGSDRAAGAGGEDRRAYPRS